ncbi:hypothetical protein ACP4OV_010843 [Aristida adscensionis]
MGRDVFWAIRGGGGQSFGIILSWKLRLVPVPTTVASFIVRVSTDEVAVDAMTRWHKLSHCLAECRPPTPSRPDCIGAAPDPSRRRPARQPARHPAASAPGPSG